MAGHLSIDHTGHAGHDSDHLYDGRHKLVRARAMMIEAMKSLRSAVYLLDLRHNSIDDALSAMDDCLADTAVALDMVEQELDRRAA